MTLATLVRGWRRVIEAPTPSYEVQIRRTLSDGHAVVQRRFGFSDLAAATSEFEKLRALGGRAYTAEHGFRLVLIKKMESGCRPSC